MKRYKAILSDAGYSVEAITMDSYSWSQLCLETVGADISWPVLGNTLYKMVTGQGCVPTTCWIL